jgi:hypothetical protein
MLDPELVSHLDRRFAESAAQITAQIAEATRQITAQTTSQVAEATAQITAQTTSQIAEATRQITAQTTSQIAEATRQITAQTTSQIAEATAQITAQTTAQVAEVTAQISAQTAAQTAALSAHDQSLRAHIDERIREVHVLVEDLRTNVQLVAEGVIATQQSLATFRGEVQREFEEVKAVNRLSYVELERKIVAARG